MIWLEHCGKRMEQHPHYYLWVCPGCHGVVSAESAYFKWRGVRA